MYKRLMGIAKITTQLRKMVMQEYLHDPDILKIKKAPRSYGNYGA